MKTYRITHVEKNASDDSYANGCDYKTRTILCESLNITASSFKALVMKAKKWAGGLDETDYVFLPEGIDTEYFGFNQLENSDGHEPSPSERARFEAGEITLYLCDYTFCFEVYETVKLQPSDLEGLTHD